MKKKTLKTVALVGAAYLAYKALSGGKGLLSGLAGLADDLIPYDINPPVMQYPPNYNPYQYGGAYPYSPYNYGAQQSYSPWNYYGQGYNYPYGYPYSPYGQTPGYTAPAPGFQFNPYGGQDYYGTYIPKVVTPSGGIQGFSY